MKPDPYNAIANLAAEYGAEAAAEVADFEAKHIVALKELIEKQNIDCDFVVTRAMDVQFSESHCRKLKAGYDNLLKSNVDATRGTFYSPEETAEGVRLPHIHRIKIYNRH